MSFEDKLRKIKPYVAGEQPQQSNVIKLNTNENPYPPAPEVQERSREFVTDILKKYPDPDIHLLNAALAKYHGVDEKRVFSGVGSDDVLSVAFLSFFDSDLPILFPDITYAFYPVWATLYRIPFTEIPLDENFRIRPEDYYGDVKENGGVVIANPNAPTSIAESADFIEDIVRHNPDSVVVVDEAYVDFGAESVLKLTEKYENLLVVRTFSKSRSMAGIRIGYAIGSPKLIATMNAVKQSINSYTMNHITIALGVASVEDDAYFKSVLAKVMKTREDATKRLRAMGFIIPDSKTNFLFAEYPGVPGEYIFTELKKRNIYVRWWPKERIKNRLRITIGTDAEMETVYKEIEKILAEYKTK